MTLRKWMQVWLVSIAALMIAGQTEVAAGVVLITPEEASLPAPRQVASARAITRGPRIEVSSIDEGKLDSPLHFKLKFLAFGGSAIDVNTLAVTYFRGPNIDLTNRIRPYAKPSGIDIPDAEVPPGEHSIRIDVKDTDGRIGSLNFILAVSQK